jgi:phosphatidylinositol alpha-1,6-mannosyltransferase
MKILYLTAPGDASAAGGIQRYSRDVGDAMSARGHDVRWLHSDPNEVFAHLAWRDRCPAPAYWDRFYFRRRTPVQDYRFHQNTARRVADTCAAFHPDVVHSFFVHNIGALNARPIPVSVTCHGIEIQELPSVLTMLRTASAVHANSRFTAALARRVAGDSVTPRVLSWGVRSTGTPADRMDYDLMTVSRLVQRKNVDTVLQALARLPPLRYVVVGDGPERARLESLARSLRLPHVKFVGEVPDDQLNALFARSRLFVMAPRISHDDFEGLGLVYYEAHGHGVPVLASNNGGVPEAVGDAGVLIDRPEDVNAVAAAIAAALTPSTLEELRRRVSVRQRTHSWESFIDAFERWHEEVAANRGRHATRAEG